MEVVPGRGARRCECRRAARLAEVLEMIPPKYREFRLADLRADAARHPAQRDVIPHVQQHPGENYLLWGDNGTGKSMILWTLMRHAAEEGRPVIGCNVKTLLTDYQLAIAANREGRTQAPRLTAAALAVRGGPPHTLCLDELDKPTVSQFAAAEFFEVIDTAYNFNHQVIVASNMSPDELTRKWEVEGGHYGRSIVRRLIDNSFLLEFPRIAAVGRRGERSNTG